MILKIPRKTRESFTKKEIETRDLRIEKSDNFLASFLRNLLRATIVALMGGQEDDHYGEDVEYL